MQADDIQGRQVKKNVGTVKMDIKAGPEFQTRYGGILGIEVPNATLSS